MRRSCLSTQTGHRGLYLSVPAQAVQLRFGWFCTESESDADLECYQSKGRAPSSFSCLQGWDGSVFEDWHAKLGEWEGRVVV